MTPEKIIEWAREAGFEFKDRAEPKLARFAQLVAAHEREVCAKVCEEWVQVYGHEDIAAAIRAALVDTVDTTEECVDETVECGHEPVAWMYTLEYGSTTVDAKVSVYQLNYPFGVCGSDYLRENSNGTSYVRQQPLYTTPQPRQWVDLTDAEIGKIYEENGRRYFCDLLGIGFARAVLTKYKEKNQV